MRDRTAERAHITLSSRRRSKRRMQWCVSKEGGRDAEGQRARRREERREEAGSYACSAPPTLSETQDSTCPPSSRRTATRKSALGCSDAVPILSVCLSDMPCMPREVLDVGRFSERTNAISNESKDLLELRATIKVLVQALIGSSSTRYATVLSWWKKRARFEMWLLIAFRKHPERLWRSNMSYFDRC